MTTNNQPRNIRSTGFRISILLGAIAGSLAAQNSFLVHNLVSDLPGIADRTDPNLVNPWGVGFGASPFWVGNNKTGTSTLYDGTGAITALVVTIPQAGGAGNAGPVTGVIQNTFGSNTNAFNVSAGRASSFIFCSEDGVISGWNGAVSGTKASILFDNSASKAVYKGCALAGTAAVPFLLAANFSAGTIDVIDGGLHQDFLVAGKNFSDPAVPAGFAPFNVQNIGGTIFVTYAKQDDAKQDDVSGPGNGYVAMFNQDGTLISTLISKGALDSPWGMAIAPANFVPFAGALLVGNFGDGKINAFNPTTGALLGTLNDLTGTPISILGLWSLNFGGAARNADPGTLYITAGIGGGPNNDPRESHGLFGSIQAAPFFLTSGVQNGASFLPGPIAPNTWIQLKGNGMSATTGTWKVPPDGSLPTSVNGVSVTLNGVSVPVYFVNNTQVSFLVPPNTPQGPVQIQVTNNGLTSAKVAATVAALAPAFFTLGTSAATGDIYIAAEHVNGSLVGLTPPVANSTPAKPGETISLYATGFGSGTGATITPTIVIDGINAFVGFAGPVGPGLFLLNVVVPPTVVTGQDVRVVGLIGNFETQPNAYIPIAQQ